MHTWKIELRGIVQGVGFRPFIFRLAQSMNVFGSVCNGAKGVEISVIGDESLVKEFLQRVISEAPSSAQISIYNLTKESDQKFFDNFQIINSSKSGVVNAFIASDIAMCSSCRDEFHDKANRRFGYEFITCTDCGPRYSILTDIPYDRHETTMEKYAMCEGCLSEYRDSENRRFHSQTNSCTSCGINLNQYFKEKDTWKKQSSEEYEQQIVEAWKRGEIVAIKGIGGFLLTCDATNESAVQLLRERKNRPHKPFAVMLPHSQLKKEVHLAEAEENELKGPISPIVLVTTSDQCSVYIDAVAPELKRLGVMIPYNPLFEKLLSSFQKPIVATSGNITKESICYTEEQATDRLLQVADHLFSNDREIVTPLDDSLVSYTKYSNHRITLRRARGMAPSFFSTIGDIESGIVAIGADLKSAFCLSHHGNIYISQYLGNLSQYHSQVSFSDVYRHVKKTIGFSPRLLLHDLHPLYFSTQYADDLIKGNNTLSKGYQHHKCHFASVLGEHDLLDKDDILGVVWDGTGYGEDGQIWGGEFFTYSNKRITRENHLQYVPTLPGDKMARFPKLAALCYNNDAIIESKLSSTELMFYNKHLSQTTQMTSSMGRLFDSVSSLLGLCDENSYEGEAAIKLEELAMEQLEGLPRSSQLEDYKIRLTDEGFDVKQLFKLIVKDVENGDRVSDIALKFHVTLVMMIKQVVDYLKIRKIAMSGGVFQNSLLVDLVIHILGGDYDLYFNEQLSPNDENIAFGQLIMYHLENELKMK